jgi:hypothetical protein
MQNSNEMSWAKLNNSTERCSNANVHSNKNEEREREWEKQTNSSIAQTNSANTDED